MKFVPPWKKLPDHSIVIDDLGNVVHRRFVGLPTQTHAYYHGQEREMIVTGRGHYREGQYLDDPKNGLLRGVVEIVKPHFSQATNLDDVWIYKPWLDE